MCIQPADAVNVTGGGKYLFRQEIRRRHAKADAGG